MHIAELRGIERVRPSRTMSRFYVISTLVPVRYDRSSGIKLAPPTVRNERRRTKIADRIRNDQGNSGRKRRTTENLGSRPFCPPRAKYIRLLRIEYRANRSIRNLTIGSINQKATRANYSGERRYSYS